MKYVFLQTLIFSLTVIIFWGCDSGTFKEMLDFPAITLDKPCGSKSDPAVFYEMDVTVSWTTIAGAEYYEIFFNDIFAIHPKTKNTRFFANDAKDGVHIIQNEQLEYNVVYQLKVRGVNYYQYQESNDACFFLIKDPRPTVTPPPDICETASPSLEFSAPDALTYEVALYREDDPNTPVATPTYDPQSFNSSNGLRTIQITLDPGVLSAGTYYWQVSAKELMSSYTTKSEPFAVVEKLIPPAGLVADVTPCVTSFGSIQLSWDNSAPGTYDVEIDGDATGFSAKNVTVDGITAVWSGTGSGIITWRVRHRFVDDGIELCPPSDWSQSSFEYPHLFPLNPILPTVSDICEGSDATIAWEAKEGETYVVDFFNGSEWEKLVDTLAVSNAVRKSVPLGTGYQWRITTMNNGCTSIDSAASNLFNTVQMPIEPDALSDDAAGCVAAPSAINLFWEDAGFGSYEVEVNPDSLGFSNTDMTVTGSSATWSGTAILTADWRVRHRNDPAGNELCPPSDWVTRSIDLPNLLPTNPDLPQDLMEICVGSTSTITWVAQADETYLVDFFDGAQWETIVNNEWVDTASKTISTSGEGYQWRIKTYRSGCESSDVKTSNLFPVLPLYTATPDAVPVDGTDPYNAIVSWTGDSPENDYIVALSSNGGTIWDEEVMVNGTMYTFQDLPEGTYQWRVKADYPCNDGWHDGDVFDVIPGCMLPAVTGLTTCSLVGQIIAKDNTSTRYTIAEPIVWDGKPTISWDAAAGATGYLIYYSDTNNPPLETDNKITVGNVLTYDFITPLGSDVEPKPWYISIQAMDTNCNGDMATIDKTITIKSVQTSGVTMSYLNLISTDLLVTEYLIDGAASPSEQNEFFELFNTLNYPINLSGLGWSYENCNAGCSDVTYTLGAWIIPPRGTVVLINSAAGQGTGCDGSGPALWSAPVSTSVFGYEGAHLTALAITQLSNSCGEIYYYTSACTSPLSSIDLAPYTVAPQCQSRLLNKVAHVNKNCSRPTSGWTTSTTPYPGSFY